MKCNHYDKLDYLIAMAASNGLQKEGERFDALDTSSVEFNASYYRKRARMIRKVNRRPAVQKMKLVFVRVAVALLVLILLAALVIGCVPVIREAVFKALVEWHDDYFKVSFQPDNSNENVPSTPSDADSGATNFDGSENETPANDIPEPPTQIEEVRKPTALPEGVYEDVIVESKLQIMIDYYLNEEFLFTYSQDLIEHQRGYGDTDAFIFDVVVKSYEGVYIENQNNRLKIVEWSDGEYRYQIMTEIYGKDELIAIAESVK